MVSWAARGRVGIVGRGVSVRGLLGLAAGLPWAVTMPRACWHDVKLRWGLKGSVQVDFCVYTAIARLRVDDACWVAQTAEVRSSGGDDELFNQVSNKTPSPMYDHLLLSLEQFSRHREL